MSQTHTRRWRIAVAVGVAVATAVAPLGAPPGQAAQLAPSQLVGFTIGADGRLYPATTGPSSGPSGPVSNAVIAPPGAGVSAVRQPDGNLATFVIGTQGALVAGTTNSASSGFRIFTDGAGGLAPPGGQVSAVSTADGVHAFFVGNDGALYGASYVQRVQPGAGPQRISATGIAPPGAVVAATRQGNVPGALFVGADGGLQSVWRTGTNTWATVPASPPGLAPPGGGVAATSGAVVYAFLTGLDGRLWRVNFAAGGLPDPWDPVAISGVGAAPVGARLAAAQFTTGQLSVFFAGADGAIRVATNLAGGWIEPAVASQPGIARPGGPISLTVVDDYVYVAWCGNNIWWWFFWWWRRPIPPPPGPPPWSGEVFSFPTSNPVRVGFDTSITMIR
ncbi:hypothetical protein [Micromonospora sp. NBC_01796]|uniref:hypothetical protein n=1 Tax=Micromonospora sp. NBC_01796 TaxID=2975987 RepID=UPI002DD9DD1D|nr:hypothetical protein [Micromonospora sp. NBC_01796]WSA84302.1 hypothetical protein OIE47_28665 [Micromonospora sp. NBC_01796]